MQSPVIEFLEQFKEQPVQNTLASLLAKTGDHHETRLSFPVIIRANGQFAPEYWKLADYAVSSVAGACLYLVPRNPQA